MKALVDVRRYPVSRRHPQFGHERLAAALHEAGVAYVHEVDLGGHRDPHADSPNTGLPDGAFRGYADHMAAPAFAAALARVESRAREAHAVVMCAEADPHKCHRRLLADALAHRGWRIRHILAPGTAEEHAPTRGTQVTAGGTLVYPSARLF